MKQEIKIEGDEKYLYLQVHANIKCAFISSTGKSLVYRITGQYLKSNGEVVGSDGVISGYISNPIRHDFIEINHRHYRQDDIIKHEFYNDGVMIPAIKILIMK